MKEGLKIVIPMAGYGSRLRPQTWSKPKPLVSAAGKPVLEHVFDVLDTAPNAKNQELVFITGYLGEQVETFMEDSFPKKNAKFIAQNERLGQSHAIAMAREYIKGPTLIAFVDTLVNTDLSFLENETADAVIWVKEVEDPRRFGVVDVDENLIVKDLVEKPDDMRLNLAVVGFYYFKNGEDLITAIDEQIEKGIRTKGEYFLADAIKLMLNKDAQVRAEMVDVWLDAGLPETVLETNQYLLEHGRDNTNSAKRRNRMTVIPPVYIHPRAEIVQSTIGPNVSIGEGCRVYGSVIRDSILESDVTITDSSVRDSIIGSRATVKGFSGTLNIGNDAEVKNK